MFVEKKQLFQAMLVGEPTPLEGAILGEPTCLEEVSIEDWVGEPTPLEGV